jgi:hypothetical protein
MARALTIAIAIAALACSGPQRPSGSRSRSAQLEGAERPENDRGRCETRGTDREVSEYDTSGDAYPDVRRVFRRIGDPPTIRLVLTCREVDLNADGVKDIVRYYNDEGRPLREEADRDFDGQMDAIIFFQNGRVVREESDTNADGRVDTKIYFERGEMVRTERDLGGRSTGTVWRPDRWEYFEHGRMVRMGTDIDGDGNVDRWDRDSQWSEAQRREEESAALEEAAEQASQPVDDGAEPAPAPEQPQNNPRP